MAGNIGFIGLGNMGFEMCANLRKLMPQSQTLHIYDVAPATSRQFESAYGEYGPIAVVNSAKDVAANSELVLSVVPTADNVREVYLDECNGIIASPQNPTRLLLECSTIDVETARQVGSEMTKAGAGTYVDTPISGGVGAARNATLAFLVGHPGEPESNPTAKRIVDVCSKMGPQEKLHFCGRLGSGLAAKIANNYISCCSMLLAAEAMAIGMRYGVDKRVLFDCITSSSGDSWTFRNGMPVPGVVANSASSRGFVPTFKPFMVIKDITLGIKSAENLGIEPSMGRPLLKAFEQTAEDPRTKDLDCTSIWLHVNGELDKH